MLTTSHVLLAGYLALAIAIVLWNVAAAGRLVHDRRAPRALAVAAALGALLLLPALLVALAAASAVYGRTVQPVAWVWPAVTLLFVIQALLAMTSRLVHPLFGVPILAYDALIAAAAAARFLDTQGLAPPHALLAVSAAMAGALSVVGGSAALSQARWLLVPLLSPALPSRSRLRRGIRAVLAAGVAAAAALVVVEIPQGAATIRSYEQYATAMLRERPAGDLTVALALFPDVRAALPPVAIVNDLRLVDSLGLDAIAVVVAPEGARGRALDSLSHVVDALRDDSTTVIVTLGYRRDARAQLRRDAAAYLRARLDDVDRLARALHPTILLPAYEPYGIGSRAVGVRPPRFWIDYLRRAAAAAHHVNPTIKVGVAAASYGVRDSALYAWAASRAAPVDIVGFSLLPGMDGAASLDTHLRIAARWMRTAASTKPHWVWAAGGYPVAHGERSQRLALRGVLAWATAQPRIQGVVVTDAGDYDDQRGLRAPDGHLRPAFDEVARAVRALREAAQ